MLYVYMTPEDDRTLLTMMNDKRCGLIDQLKVFLERGETDHYTLTLKMLKLIAKANTLKFSLNPQTDPAFIPFHVSTNKYKDNGVSALHKKVINSLDNGVRHIPRRGLPALTFHHKEDGGKIYGLREKQSNFFKSPNDGAIKKHTKPKVNWVFHSPKKSDLGLSKMAIANLLNSVETPFASGCNFEFKK